MMRMILAVMVLALSGHARAQIPVTDGAMIGVLGNQTLMQWAEYAKEALRWAQQLQQMEAQLRQYQAMYAAITGGRGYSVLSSGLNSESAAGYLPDKYDDATQIARETAQTARRFLALYQYAQRARGEISILTDKTFRGKQDPNYLRWIAIVEQLAAQKGINRQIYDQGTVRMARIQNLADRISATQDQKAIEELQAVMKAESMALQADQIRAQAIQQAFAVEERILRQQHSDAIVQTAETPIPRINPREAIFR